MAQDIIVGEFNHPLLDQLAVYLDKQDELEQRYFGQWIVLCGGEIMAHFPSYDDVEAYVLDRDRNQDIDITACLIRQVGAPTAILLSHA